MEGAENSQHSGPLQSQLYGQRHDIYAENYFLVSKINSDGL